MTAAPRETSVESKPSREGRWPAFAKPAATALLVAAVTYGLGLATAYLFTEPDAAQPIWWPVSGAVLAILVRSPRRWWALLLTVFAGAGVLASLPSVGAAVGATLAAASVVEIAIPAFVVTAATDVSIRRLRTPAEDLRFILVQAGTVTAAGLLIAAPAISALNPTSWTEVTGDYVIAHALGMIAMAPFLLPADQVQRAIDGAKRAGLAAVRLETVEPVLVFVAVIGVDYWAFVGGGAPSFVVLLPLVWASLRLAPWPATSAALLTAAAAAFGAARRQGPFSTVETAVGSQFAAPTLLAQALIASITAMTLILVISRRYRMHLLARAEDGERIMSLALRDALFGVFTISVEPGHEGEILDVNWAFARMLEHRRGGLIGRNWSVLNPPFNPGQEDHLATWLDELANGESDTTRRETRFVTKSGRGLWTEVVTTRVRPQTGPPFVFLHVHDLTERERAKQELERIALHDALTGLPNRALLFERLDQQMRHSDRDDSLMGLLYLDLDGFKPVNDEHGHDAGDVVLVETARRLRGAIRAEDTAARLGGDEFAILCARPVRLADVNRVADRVREAMARPIRLPSGLAVMVGVSIGSAMGGSETGSDGLIRAADQAMFEVKRGKPDRARLR